MGSLHDDCQPQTPPLLFQECNQLGPIGRCSPSPLDITPAICFPSHSASPTGTLQSEEGLCNPQTHSPLLTSSILVHRASSPLDLSTSTPSFHPESPHPATGPVRHPNPDILFLTAWYLDGGSRLEKSCSTPVRGVLTHSRCPSTRVCYQAKWCHFVE